MQWTKSLLELVKQQKRMLIVMPTQLSWQSCLRWEVTKIAFIVKHHFCCITVKIRLPIVRLSPRGSFSKAQCLILKKSRRNSSLKIQDRRTWPWRPVRYTHPHQMDLPLLNQAIRHLRKTRQLHEHRQAPKGSERDTSRKRLQRELSQLQVGNRIQE